jgi:hypothetical protein
MPVASFLFWSIMGQPTYGVKLITNVLHILREKSIRFNQAPTPKEVAIALDYIGGRTAKDIMHETGESLENILVALKRTRDEIRRGKSPVQALHRFPKVVAWQVAKFPLDESKHNGEAKEAPPDDIFKTPPAEIAKHSVETALTRANIKITAKITRQIQAITEFNFTQIDPEKPETLEKFLGEVRAVTFQVIGPLAGQLLAANLANGESMQTGLEVAGLLPKGKGLTLAQQFNFGSAKDDKGKRMRSGMGFERLLDAADQILDSEVVK